MGKLKENNKKKKMRYARWYLKFSTYEQKGWLIQNIKTLFYYPIKRDIKLEIEGGCLCLRATKSIISIGKSQTQKGQLIEERRIPIYLLCAIPIPFAQGRIFITSSIQNIQNKKERRITRRTTTQLGKRHLQPSPSLSLS